MIATKSEFNALANFKDYLDHRRTVKMNNAAPDTREREIKDNLFKSDYTDTTAMIELLPNDVHAARMIIQWIGWRNEAISAYKSNFDPLKDKLVIFGLPTDGVYEKRKADDCFAIIREWCAGENVLLMKLSNGA